MNTGGDRKIIYALLGIAVLCLIGLGGSLYHSKAFQLKELQQALSKKQAELTDTKAKVEKLPELEQQYQGLRARLAVLEPTLPNAAYIPTFLRQIEGLAIGTNNDLLLIRPKPAVKKTGASSAVAINNETGEVVKEQKKAGAPAGNAAEKKEPELPYDFVPIEVRLQGTYWTVINFLSQLQRFPKMIAVNDISFSPTQGGTEGRSPNLTASMGLTAVVTKGGSDGRPA
jgi:Tfp pilus assembly protein PilO